VLFFEVPSRSRPWPLSASPMRLHKAHRRFTPIQRKKKMSYGRTNDLAQAQTMIDLFREAHGRTPDTKVELCQFLEEECAAGRIPDGPIQPSPTALLKIAR